MKANSFYQHFRKFVLSFKTQDDCAKFLGISKQFVGDMFHGRRAISGNVADKLGFKREVIFVPKDKTP